MTGHDLDALVEQARSGDFSDGVIVYTAHHDHLGDAGTDFEGRPEG